MDAVGYRSRIPPSRVDPPVEYGHALIKFSQALARTRWPKPGVRGVYGIWNTLRSKGYIGSSKDIQARWYEHLSNLRHGTANRRLQNAWDKYGSSLFRFVVLEVVGADDNLAEIEQLYIDRFDTAGVGGYNVRRIATSNSGAILFSTEQRARLSEIMKARLRSGWRPRQSAEGLARAIQKRAEWWNSDAGQIQKELMRTRNRRGRRNGKKTDS